MEKSWEWEKEAEMGIRCYTNTEKEGGPRLRPYRGKNERGGGGSGAD
jgi:hypothetical protein